MASPTISVGLAFISRSCDRDMLNRFPNLLLLDGALVPRIDQDIKVGGKTLPISSLQMSAMQSQPFTWPCDVMPGYRETPEIEAFVVDFLAKWVLNIRVLYGKSR